MLCHFLDTILHQLYVFSGEGRVLAATDIMQLIVFVPPQILNKFKRNDVEKVSCVTKSTKLQENCFGELNSACLED